MFIQVASAFKAKPHSWIDRTPSIVLVKQYGIIDGEVDSVSCQRILRCRNQHKPALILRLFSKDRKALNLAEFFGDGMSLKEWISKGIVRLVDELTATNFALYESLRLPMLIMFLNLT